MIVKGFRKTKIHSVLESRNMSIASAAGSDAKKSDLSSDSKPLLSIKFLSLTGSSLTIETYDMKLGDFFLGVVKNNKIGELYSTYGKLTTQKNGKCVNACYHLHDMLSEYMNEGMIKFFLIYCVPGTECLEITLKNYKEGKPWPPCDNYGATEPLNMLKFGPDSRSDHTCPRCHGDKYQKKHDNSDENMVVIIPPNSKARIGYNKYMLLEWFNNQIENGNDPTEPTTRLPISETNYLLILTGGHYNEVRL